MEPLREPEQRRENARYAHLSGGKGRLSPPGCPTDGGVGAPVRCRSPKTRRESAFLPRLPRPLACVVLSIKRYLSPHDWKPCTDLVQTPTARGHPQGANVARRRHSLHTFLPAPCDESLRRSGNTLKRSSSLDCWLRDQDRCKRSSGYGPPSLWLGYLQPGPHIPHRFFCLPLVDCGARSRRVKDFPGSVPCSSLTRLAHAGA